LSGQRQRDRFTFSRKRSIKIATLALDPRDKIGGCLLPSDEPHANITLNST